ISRISRAAGVNSPCSVYLRPPWMMPCDATVCPAPSRRASSSTARSPRRDNWSRSHSPAAPPPKIRTSSSISRRVLADLSAFAKIDPRRNSRFESGRGTMWLSADRSFNGELPMRIQQFVPLAIGMLFVAIPVLRAEDTPKQTLSAVERGVAIVEKAGRNYPTHRKCFACHHQTLPLLALNEAQATGAKIDEVLPGLLAEFTTTSF